MMRMEELGGVLIYLPWQMTSDHGSGEQHNILGPKK